MKLSNLGYDEFFETERERSGLGVFPVARVIAEHRGVYRITNGEQEYSAKVTGKRMYEASSREDYPVVGDWVAYEETGPEQAVVRGIIPRRTFLRRKESGGTGTQLIGANIDVAFIVQAVGRDFSVNRLERYTTAIVAGGVKPDIILNKADLATDAELEAMSADIRSRLPDAQVFIVSSHTGAGIADLRARLQKGKTYCFVGSSGVGKSSIINALIGEERLATGHVGEKSARGRHVTTARSLSVLDSGAMVIDNPGMREFGIIEVEEGIGQVFDTIAELELACKFSDCTHTNEPKCAIREAIESGTVNSGQYESYMKLKRENEFTAMSDLERRRKDRAFGKHIKQVLSVSKRNAPKER